MRIVFYNTNSNFFDPKIVHIKTMPSWAEEWNKVAAQFPEHEFVIAAMLPAMFLLDYNADGIVHPSPSSSDNNDNSIVPPPMPPTQPPAAPRNISRIELRGENSEEIAAEILALKPDIALAASFWITPYDWLGLQDAMVAEILRASGVRTVCHNAQTEAICFDKHKTRIFLERNGFKCARGVLVQYELFWCARKNPQVRNNVYREHILNEISKLNFPVVIKDTTGLSSYGIEVVPTLNAARAYLESKKFNSDRLVEEFIDGLQFGTEVHTIKKSDGSFTPVVFPPLMYSVNQYGITSPKQSVKLGPLSLDKYKTESLSRELERLARLLQFEGIAQIDLAFHNGEWHIIEINPRLSGSTAAIALIKQKSLPLILTELALGTYDARAADLSMQVAGKPLLYLNIKFPNLTQEQMTALYALPFVKYLCQTDNDAARQRREMGFCEILFGGTSSPRELLDCLDEIKRRFPDVIEMSFYETARRMVATAFCD